MYVACAKAVENCMSVVGGKWSQLEISVVCVINWSSSNSSKEECYCDPFKYCTFIFNRKRYVSVFFFTPSTRRIYLYFVEPLYAHGTCHSWNMM